MKSYVMGVIGALTVVAAAMGIAWAADIFKIEKGGVAYLNLTDAGNMSLSGYIQAANFGAVPQAQWPDFDAGSPYLLKNALWVGWDDTLKVWKYNRQAGDTRGLTDPGNPNTWAVNGTTIGYFDGNLILLPSGTHINNRYDPRMMAAKCNQDDIQVKVGSAWVDKYACRIIDVTSSYGGTTWKDDTADLQVSAQATPPYWMAFSQRGRASTGMTWFVAQQAAINAGKRMITNEEWH